jgi:hypothetical protein
MYGDQAPPGTGPHDRRCGSVLAWAAFIGGLLDRLVEANNFPLVQCGRFARCFPRASQKSDKQTSELISSYLHQIPADAAGREAERKNVLAL